MYQLTGVPWYFHKDISCLFCFAWVKVILWNYCTLSWTYIAIMMEFLLIKRVSYHWSWCNMLYQTAVTLGMTLHPSKSKFLTVNLSDTQPFHIGNIIISATDQYQYLGTTISNNTIADQIQNHINSKKCHERKFGSFLRKNSDAPFVVKIKVWDSAMCSAILYSSEIWLTNNLKCVSNI